MLKKRVKFNSEPSFVRTFKILVVTAILSAAVSACVPLPLSDTGATGELLAPIEIGVTTNAEVKKILGDPDIIWESERVWIYEQGPSGAFLWIIPGHYTAAVFLTELGEDIIILRFDKSGQIERLDRCVGPIDRRDYGDFLREWVMEKFDKPVENSNL